MCAPRAIDGSGELVLSYVRWVMVNKRDAAAETGEAVVPELETRCRSAIADGAEGRISRSSTSRHPAARICGTITRSAKRSTMSTA